MRNTIILISWLLCAAFTAQGQYIDTYKVRKSVVQSFPAKEITHIKLEIEGQVDVQVWGQTAVCVQMSIIPEKSGFKAIKMLAEEGYYDVDVNHNNNNLTVFSKQPISKLLSFNGERQVTCIEYKIYIPEGVQVTDVLGRDLLTASVVAN